MVATSYNNSNRNIFTEPFGKVYLNDSDKYPEFSSRYSSLYTNSALFGFDIHSFYSKLFGTYYYNKNIRKQVTEYLDKADYKNSIVGVNVIRTNRPEITLQNLIDYSIYLISKKDEIIKLSASSRKKMKESILSLYTENIVQLLIDAIHEDSDIRSIVDFIAKINNSLTDIHSFNPLSVIAKISDYSIPINVSSEELETVNDSDTEKEREVKKEKLNNFLSSLFESLEKSVNTIDKENQLLLGVLYTKGYSDSLFDDKKLMEMLDLQVLILKYIFITYIGIHVYINLMN